MRVAIINSNNVKIGSDSKKGTEIFAYTLIKNLAKRIREENLQMEITAFASGDSDLPVKTESINQVASSMDETIPDEKHIIFELALISEALARQDEFDLFHINIGDGDIALPYARFIKKPILITLHNTQGKPYVEKYFNLFKDLPNVFYVSVSNAQRKYFPDLNYAGTIYHGIDVDDFAFSIEGGDDIMWGGRAIPKKGMDIVIKIASMMQKSAKLFCLTNRERNVWFENQREKIGRVAGISLKQNLERLSLVREYQTSKCFLFPIQWEEPFGLVVAEAMACGTPVVAYACGSMPEIIKDGKTGFLVNPTGEDKRGNWLIKRTGVEGLREAVERIYSMSEGEYRYMREACRKRVEENFSVERMVENYIQVYKDVGAR